MGPHTRILASPSNNQLHQKKFGKILFQLGMGLKKD